MPIAFSIIIPVGPKRDAHTALGSLLTAELEEGDEVIVVGDGHQPEVPESCAALPIWIEELEAGNGANAARNQGAARAGNDIFCFLDDDDAYVRGALSTLRQRIIENPEARAWSLGWQFRSGRSSRSRPDWLSEKHLCERNVAGGCSCMVLRRDTFEQAGRFDPDMPAMQDWDLWLRVAQATPIRAIKDEIILYEDRCSGRISTDSARRIAGFECLLEKNHSLWPASVVSFHESRLASVRASVGKGTAGKVFRWRAPIASVYFLWQAVRNRKAPGASNKFSP